MNFNKNYLSLTRHKRGRRQKQGLEATRTPSILDIHWAAGIYEGEGSVSSGGQLAVGQKDPEILERLKEMFGGTISPQRVHNVIRAYIWQTCAERARGIAMTLYPLLTKHRQDQIKMWLALQGVGPLKEIVAKLLQES